MESLNRNNSQRGSETARIVRAAGCDNVGLFVNSFTMLTSDKAVRLFATQAVEPTLASRTEARGGAHLTSGRWILEFLNSHEAVTAEGRRAGRQPCTCHWLLDPLRPCPESGSYRKPTALAVRTVCEGATAPSVDEAFFSRRQKCYARIALDVGQVAQFRASMPERNHSMAGQRSYSRKICIV